MLDRMWKKVYPHIFKKPCYTCLTLAACQNKHPWQRDCDIKRIWKAREYKVETKLDFTEAVIAMSMFITFIALICATFILGLWKWCDLIIYWMS